MSHRIRGICCFDGREVRACASLPGVMRWKRLAIDPRITSDLGLDLLVEPLVIPTRIMRRNTAANAGLIRERGHCETDFETEAAATQIRH